MNDLSAAAQGAKPSAASIAKLADDLDAAITGNKKLHAQQQKLAQEVHAIFNSSHLSAAQQQKICDDVQKILEDGGASPDNAAKWSTTSRRSRRKPNKTCRRSNVRHAKNPATGSPENSRRFVRSAASWLTSANGSMASTPFPSRCARNILKNSPTCRPANIWTNRKLKIERANRFGISLPRIVKHHETTLL